MSYRLRDDISFCRVDDHLIFLDLRNDRYFRLPDTIERVFLAYSDGDEAVSEQEINTLLKHDILTHVPADGPHIPAPAIAWPTHSAMEQKTAAQKLDALAVLEVFAIVCSMRLQLKTRRLKTILDHLVSYRQTRTARAPSLSPEAGEQCLLDAASVFRRARLYVPIETSCLLDSLCMTRFLARRRLSVNIVFGVTRAPFSAHCWVQTGNLVLNDTVGNARTHTPIRRV